MGEIDKRERSCKFPAREDVNADEDCVEKGEFACTFFERICVSAKWETRVK